MDFADTAGVARRFGFGEQIRALGIGGKHGFEQAFRTAWRLLQQISNACILRKAYRPIIRGDLTRNEAKKGCFARSVASDEANLVAVGNARRRLFKKRTALNSIAEIVDVKHARKMFEMSRWRKLSGAFFVPRKVAHSGGFRHFAFREIICTREKADDALRGPFIGASGISKNSGTRRRLGNYNLFGVNLGVA